MLLLISFAIRMAIASIRRVLASFTEQLKCLMLEEHIDILAY
jgi:hypothetical protein